MRFVLASGEHAVRSMLCPLVLLVPIVTAGAVKAADSIAFDGQTLDLAYRASDAKDGIREFIPKGETLENWTKLAAIREHADIDDPSAMVKAVIKGLRARYPKAPFKVMVNRETDEAIIDFVVWPDDGSFAEFNVFRYAKRPRGGLVSQQYALRAYGDDAAAFLKGLRPVRERLVDAMARTGLTRDGVGLVGFAAAELAESTDETADAWETIDGSSEANRATGRDHAESAITNDLLEDAEDDASEDGDDATGDAEEDKEDDESEDE